jgi:hypothetical protein
MQAFHKAKAELLSPTQIATTVLVGTLAAVALRYVDPSVSLAEEAALVPCAMALGHVVKAAILALRPSKPEVALHPPKLHT